MTFGAFPKPRSKPETLEAQKESPTPELLIESHAPELNPESITILNNQWKNSGN